ncbi:MAG TPA: HAD hydrolase-like protein [Candidatus Saccharimonadales bacterium]|nr:HAD hydrolase-like protein [Candidatus Saccharimonadales bacterium]
MSDIVFDFDGTIADSFEVAEQIFYELTGYEPITDPRQRDHLRSLSLLKAAKELHISPAQIPRLLIMGRSLMQRRMYHVKLFPNVSPVLRKLHESGNRLFIITSNSRPNVENFLQQHDLGEYFDGVYGNVGLFRKGRALRKVMRRDHIFPQSCFYIGDEVRDIHAARYAHVKAIAVAWGYNDFSALTREKPYAVAQRPDDLIEILKKQ